MSYVKKNFRGVPPPAGIGLKVIIAKNKKGKQGKSEENMKLLVAQGNNKQSLHVLHVLHLLHVFKKQKVFLLAWKQAFLVK